MSRIKLLSFVTNSFRLEAERIAELTRKMEYQKSEALRLQWEEAERQKEKAVEDACKALTIKLNKEHRLDKELSIGHALKVARVNIMQLL